MLTLFVFQDLDLGFVGLSVDSDPQLQRAPAFLKTLTAILRPKVVGGLHDHASLLRPRAHHVAGRNSSRRADEGMVSDMPQWPQRRWPPGWALESVPLPAKLLLRGARRAVSCLRVFHQPLPAPSRFHSPQEHPSPNRLPAEQRSSSWWLRSARPAGAPCRADFPP